MITQKDFQTIIYWANDHLTVSGSDYRLIDNVTNQQTFQCYAQSTFEAVRQCINFSRKQWEQS